MTNILKDRKDAKFIKDLEKKLNAKGYELVAYTPAQFKGRHGTVTVKNPETQQVVESTYSSKTSPRAVKNLVSQIVKLFTGRGRRGQGEFKLSLDTSHREEWFGVLKRSGKGGMNIYAKEAVDKVMADGVPKTVNEIYERVYDVLLGRSSKSVPLKREIAMYLRGNKKYNNVKGVWSLVEEGA